MSIPTPTDVAGPTPPGRLRAVALPVWCVTAAFGTYFCMYGYRKPFTAGFYEGATVAGIGFKTVLVTAQVLGYMLSKFVGIKVIAEMRPERRAGGILVLIGLAQASLLGFGLVPAPVNALFLFVNGLALGMVFGLVLGFLEGRRQTEALVAGLCASFILADGVAKSVGARLLQTGISEFWMPFAAGLVFAGPLLVFVAMLARIPPPTAADVAHRSERPPMTRGERRAFFARYAPGLIVLVCSYVIVTILRSIRADFAPEVWKGLGFTGQPGIFTQSEMLVMLGVIAVNGSSVIFRDNRRAFFVAMAASMAGLALVGLSALVLPAGLGGFAFMVLVGLGLYVPYVAVHTTIFERLIAMSRDRANIGYLLYLADAFGYLGYVAVMIAQGLWTAGAAPSDRGDFLGFFRSLCLVASVLGIVALGFCWAYFARRSAATASQPEASRSGESAPTPIATDPARA